MTNFRINVSCSYWVQHTYMYTWRMCCCCPLESLYEFFILSCYFWEELERECWIRVFCLHGVSARKYIIKKKIRWKNASRTEKSLNINARNKWGHIACSDYNQRGQQVEYTRHPHAHLVRIYIFKYYYATLTSLTAFFF